MWYTLLRLWYVLVGAAECDLLWEKPSVCQYCALNRGWWRGLAHWTDKGFGWDHPLVKRPRILVNPVLTVSWDGDISLISDFKIQLCGWCYIVSMLKCALYGIFTNLNRQIYWPKAMITAPHHELQPFLLTNYVSYSQKPVWFLIRLNTISSNKAICSSICLQRGAVTCSKIYICYLHLPSLQSECSTG